MALSQMAALEPAPLHPRCYSTLLFKDDNATVLRRVFEEDEFMVALWARRMLLTTQLPIFVVHTREKSLDPALVIRLICDWDTAHFQPRIDHSRFHERLLGALEVAQVH